MHPPLHQPPLQASPRRPLDEGRQGKKEGTGRRTLPKHHWMPVFYTSARARARPDHPSGTDLFWPSLRVPLCQRVCLLRTPQIVCQHLHQQLANAPVLRVHLLAPLLDQLVPRASRFGVWMRIRASMIQGSACAPRAKAPAGSDNARGLTCLRSAARRSASRLALARACAAALALSAATCRYSAACSCSVSASSCLRCDACTRARVAEAQRASQRRESEACEWHADRPRACPPTMHLHEEDGGGGEPIRVSVSI